MPQPEQVVPAIVQEAMVQRQQSASVETLAVEVPESSFEITVDAAKVESKAIRKASVLEHMMVDNLIANPVDNAVIRVRDPEPDDALTVSSVAHLSDTVPKSMQLSQRLIRLETEVNGKAVYSHATVQEKAFSAYAHFIDRWDNDVFLSNDKILGDFHVNSQIRLADTHSAQPRIHGRFTIGVNQLLGRDFQNEQVFLQGVESGVGMIPMDTDPLRKLLAEINEGAANIHYFRGHTELKFLPDGSVHWQSLEDSEHSGQITASSTPQVIINEERHRFELSGAVNGHFLVYSPHQILITGSLQYVSHPTEALTVTSPLLGLVSRRSVEIASRSTTGSGDLEIDAAIYAARRFSVRRFDDSHQGNLHIFGSLTAGSISATEPRFTTLIEKDPRLDMIRPPGFPLTGQTILTEWDGNWFEIPQ